MTSATLEKARSIAIIAAASVAVVGSLSSMAIFLNENVASRSQLMAVEKRQDCIEDYELDILSFTDLRENIYALYLNTKIEILAARLGKPFDEQETNLALLQSKKEGLWEQIAAATEIIENAVAELTNKCKGDRGLGEQWKGGLFYRPS